MNVQNTSDFDRGFNTGIVVTVIILLCLVVIGFGTIGLRAVMLGNPSAQCSTEQGVK